MTKGSINVGNFTEAKRWLSSAQQVLAGMKDQQQSIKLQEELQGYSQSLRMLDSARDYLRKGSQGQAQALYEEIIELFGDTLPATVFAEAALAKESSEPDEAVRLYQLGAQKATSREIRSKLMSKAREIEDQARVGKPIARSMVAEVAPEEHCSVCHMAIQGSDEYSRCPQCGSPAHYAHLAEWIKIRGTCPVCRAKIKIQAKESVTAS